MRIKVFQKEIAIFLACFPFLFLIMYQIIKIGSINKFNVSLLVIANLIPLLLLLLFLLHELGIISSLKKSYFEISDNGVIHIPIFNICFSIFESTSIDLVNNKGLYRLIDLELFSLEIDNETKSLRVFLFSKSKTSQINRIKQSMPLLEAIFPDILLMTPNDSKNFLSSYSLAEVAGFSIIQGKESYLLPVLGHSKAGQLGVDNRMILAYNSSEKGSKTIKDDRTSQIYTLPKYREPVDFNFIGNLILKKNDNSEFEEDNKNKLLRAIIRFQLSSCDLISFHEGVSYFQKALSESGIDNQSAIMEVQSKDDFTQNTTEIKSEISMINTNNEVINPICVELCNIYNNLEIDEINKSRLCNSRLIFCKKLIRNDNFISLLMEFTKKDNDEKSSKLFGELLTHLSFHLKYIV
ncbi:MAG: hypothetical protein ACW97W_13350 [Candidatus Hodarchaeales archaeon]|jgi:hypothetical protein